MRKAARTVKPNARTGERHTWKDRERRRNDRKGDKSKVRYATIGFVAEYGTSSHAARPYMTVANEKAHEKVVEAQRSIWESETGE